MKKFFAKINESKFVKRWKSDTVFRENITLYGSLLFNSLYSAFLLCLGIYHQAFWFYSLSGYYFLLALMRLSLLKHIKRYDLCEKMHLERLKCRLCGIALIFMSLALGAIVFFMVYWGRTFVHHEITTIALATFTFTSLTLAIINAVKYRKYNSPVLYASKVVSLTSACVSMLILTSTMLTSFSDAGQDEFTKIMLALTGIGVILVDIAMATILIIISKRTEEK